MEFPGVDFQEQACGNWRVQFKKKCNFQAPEVFKKKKCHVEFPYHGSLALLDARTWWYLILEIPRGISQLWRISRWWKLVFSEISTGTSKVGYSAFFNLENSRQNKTLQPSTLPWIPGWKFWKTKKTHWNSTWFPHSLLHENSTWKFCNVQTTL